MKKLLGIVVLGLLWCGTNFTTVEAKSYNLDRATGDCKLTKNLFPTMNYDVYENTFINLKLDFKFESGATYREEGLLKNWYLIEKNYREATMSCLTGKKETCKKIIEHTKYLAENKAFFNNYGGPDNNDWYEATFINNHGISHVLFAYWVASQKISIDEKVKSKISKWAIKAVKKNSTAKRPQGLNNHSLNSAKAYILAGGIFNNEKILSNGEKTFKKYLKKEFKKINDEHVVLPIEAERGSRGLYYTGRTINVMLFLATLLTDSGRNQYNDEFFEKIDNAINFMLDADVDNSLIYPWAKRNKNAFGDYKKQITDPATYAWAPAYLNISKNSKLNTKIYSNKNIKYYFINERKKYNRSRWTLIDSKCVHPGKWTKSN